jgi:hypothetical protein
MLTYHSRVYSQPAFISQLSRNIIECFFVCCMTQLDVKPQLITCLVVWFDWHRFDVIGVRPVDVDIDCVISILDQP